MHIKKRGAQLTVTWNDSSENERKTSFHLSEAPVHFVHYSSKLSPWYLTKVSGPFVPLDLYRKLVSRLRKRHHIATFCYTASLREHRRRNKPSKESIDARNQALKELDKPPRERRCVQGVLCL